MTSIIYQPIGTIRTPFAEREGTPIQPAYAAGVEGTVEVREEFRPGLADLAGFSHVILVYHFHRSLGFDLQVVPFRDSVTRGVFATRAPRRPNPIGLSVVRLAGINGCTVSVVGVDVLDGTPLLDIKPYVPQFDAADDVSIGWLADAGQADRRTTSDDRFR